MNTADTQDLASKGGRYAVIQTSCEQLQGSIVNVLRSIVDRVCHNIG